jgi:leucyl-tRNA synthetase
MVTHAIYVTRDDNDRPVYHLPEDVEVDGIGRAARRDGEAVEVIPSAKMSKSKKNVVDPVNIIAAYGADTARWFVLSDSPARARRGMDRLGRRGRLKHLAGSGGWPTEIAAAGAGAQARTTRLLREMHKTIHDVTWASKASASTPRSPALRLHQHAGEIQGGAAAKAQAMMTLAQLMSADDPASGRRDLGHAGRRGAVANAPGRWPIRRCWSTTP